MQTRYAFLVCNLNVAASVQGDYNALGCVKGRIESVLRVMVVFLTTYEFQIYLTTYVWFMLINFAVLLIFLLSVYNTYSHLSIFGHTYVNDQNLIHMCTTIHTGNESWFHLSQCDCLF
jgi:hypothetical protein